MLGNGTMQELRAGIRGRVITPTDSEYDAARSVWNGMIDKRPAVVVRCAGVADVVTAVQFARSQGLDIAVRGGGHGLPGFATVDGGLVIDLSAMRAVRVDESAARARVDGGATWADVDHETQSFGLAVTGGLVSSTGVGGFTLGGGIGWLMRRYGLASDNLVGADVVTADGRVVHASESENADLLWGLRGGGGNFGVVTSFEFKLYRIGPTVLAGPIFYPAADSSQVLRKWAAYTADAPDEITSLVSLGSAPPIPPIPAELHGQKIVTVVACYAGAADEGTDAAAPLHSLGQPIADLLGPMPYVAFQALPDPGWGAGARNYFTSTYLAGLPDEATEVVAEFHRQCPSPMAEIHIHHMGGAVARVDADQSAFANRDAPYLLNSVGRWIEPADDAAMLEWARSLRDGMSRFSTGHAYVNFLGEGDERVRDSYDSGRYARLAALKAKWDPMNVFHLNQNIPPAGG